MNERKTAEESEAIRGDIQSLLDPKGEKKLLCKDFVSIGAPSPPLRLTC